MGGGHQAVEPFDAGMLPVGDGHALYFEQAGRPDGIAVLCLHGGPGSGFGARLRTLYDGTRHRIVFFDQRGAGRSTPAGETRHNTTLHLVADIERLRRCLRIERWLVSGGSWGASLALAYAAAHPAATSGLLLRSVFLTGETDLDWFFGQAAALAPQAWQALACAWPDELPGREVPAALLSALRDPDRAARVARDWQRYEQALGTPDAPMAATAMAPADAADAAADAALVAKYRLQSAYLSRHCDLGEAVLLNAARTLRGLPCALLHGTADRVCRPSNSDRLARAIGTARLVTIPGAGHDPFHPGMQDAFVDLQRGFSPESGFGGLESRAVAVDRDGPA